MSQYNMKYIFFVLGFIFLVGCDNELNLVADHKETPVVYGFLDQSDTAQYVRVERTFVDEAVSGTVIAQNPDSLYYENIVVKIVRVKTGEEFILNRVDGNLEGYPREEGVFAQSPNYIYKIDTEDITLVQEDIYELHIEGVYEDRDIVASAAVLKRPFFAIPQSGGVVSFKRNNTINVAWNPQGDPTIYSASFFFRIEETKGGVTEERILEWIIEKNTDEIKIEADGIEFFSFMKTALEDDPSITREFKEAQFQLTSGNQTIADYIKVGQANLGITSSGEIPTFSNLSEGLGFFASKVSERRVDISLSDITLDSLMRGSLTESLNFE